jgi:hypothetical protein
MFVASNASGQMNRLLTLVVTFGVAALAVWAQNLDAPTALKMGQTGANTFVGIISDSSCGARHKMMDKSAEECTRTCQRAGAKYVLVAGEKVYALSGRTNDVAYLAGQKAKITGSLQGNSIAVSAAGPIR